MKNYSMQRGSIVHKKIELFLRSKRKCNKNDEKLLVNLETTLKHLKWKYLECERLYRRANVSGRIDAVFQCGLGKILVDWKVTRRDICIHANDRIHERFDAFNGDYTALYFLQMNLYDFLYNQKNTQMYIGNIVGTKIKMIKCQRFSRQFMERIINNFDSYKSECL